MCRGAYGKSYGTYTWAGGGGHVGVGGVGFECAKDGVQSKKKKNSEKKNKSGGRKKVPGKATKCMVEMTGMFLMELALCKGQIATNGISLCENLQKIATAL